MKQLYNGAEVRALKLGTGTLVIYQGGNVCVGRYRGTGKSIWMHWNKWQPFLDFGELDIDFDSHLFIMYALAETEFQFFKMLMEKPYHSTWGNL